MDDFHWTKRVLLFYNAVFFHADDRQLQATRKRTNSNQTTCLLQNGAMNNGTTQALDADTSRSYQSVASASQKNQEIERRPNEATDPPLCRAVRGVVSACPIIAFGFVILAYIIGYVYVYHLPKDAPRLDQNLGLSHIIDELSPCFKLKAELNATQATLLETLERNHKLQLEIATQATQIKKSFGLGGDDANGEGMIESYHIAAVNYSMASNGTAISKGAARYLCNGNYVTFGPFDSDLLQAIKTSRIAYSLGKSGHLMQHAELVILLATKKYPQVGTVLGRFTGARFSGSWDHFVTADVPVATMMFAGAHYLTIVGTGKERVDLQWVELLP